MRQSNLAMAIMRVLSGTVSSVSQARRVKSTTVNLPGENVKAGSNRKARSSFKQNRRLQMKSGNFKAKF